MAYDENIYARIISGEVTAEEIEQLKSTGEWEEIETILQATEELELNPHDKEAGYEALLKKRGGQTSERSGTIRRLWPIISAAAVALLVIGFFFLNGNSSKKVLAQNSQTKKLSLDGKFAITLNDGSSLEYEEGDKEGSRTVHLDGEAFFDVIPGNHLIVQTAQGKVEVLGTQFNVRAWGNQLSVECYQGRVIVASKNGQTELQKMEAVLSTNVKLNPKSNINHTSPSWLNGNTRIKQEPLTEVFKELERQYNVSVKFSLSNRVYAGEFPHNDLEKALDDICKPMGLTYKIIKPDLVEIYE